MRYFATFVVTALVAAAAEASTTHTLLGRNVVTVTESRMTCMNGQSTSVTTGVRGELHVLSTVRTDFKGDRWNRRMTELDRVPDDERGHVVASVFGGPVAEWNLVPQHRSINRRINAQGSLLNRWDEFEKWAREQLGKQNGAPVRFEIKVRYAAKNGCRPIGFDVEASSRVGPGFSARFDNGPYGSFAASSNPSKSKPTKPRKTRSLVVNDEY